jgi:ABC-2 type transport system permease protein
MIVAAEFRKLRTVPGTWLLLGVAQLVIVAGVSGLMVSRDDTTSLDAQRGAVAHIGLVALFSLLLGITAVAGEYRHRTITDAYLATPRRDRVVLAKLAVSAGAGVVFGLVAAATVLITTAIWLAAKGSSLELGSWDLWRTVLGGVGWNVAFAAIGVGVGALITNLIAAVAAALAWLALVEGIVAQLVGDAGRWLPFALGSALDGLPGAADGPPQWQAALALTAYAAAFVAGAVATTVRRDVT